MDELSSMDNLGIYDDESLLPCMRQKVLDEFQLHLYRPKYPKFDGALKPTANTAFAQGIQSIGFLRRIFL
jgi:hypothetical protein